MNLQRFLPWTRKPKPVVIGHLPVEAGCVLLLDPCWLRDKLFPGNQEVEAWYESTVVGQIDQAKDEHWPVSAAQAGQKGAPLSLGHLVITGKGDGYYPVEATYLPDGTVSELRIVFQPTGT